MSEEGNSPDFPYIAEHIFAPIYPVIASHIVEQSGIRQGICLDLGCGIASLGIAVAEITDMRVYGVDFSEKMCRLSQDKVYRHCLSGKVIPVYADVHMLPFRSNCADLHSKPWLSIFLERPACRFYGNLPRSCSKWAGMDRWRFWHKGTKSTDFGKNDRNGSGMAYQFKKTPQS